MGIIYNFFSFITKYSYSFGLSILILLILMIFKYIKLKEKMQMLKSKSNILEKNYQEIQSTFQNYIYTYHDIKNHLVILSNYCKKEENKKAVKYIEKISKPIVQINQYFISNNIVMDIILNYKIDEAKRKNIMVEAEIDTIGELSIDENDLCAILANLMDNAIEACQSIEKEKRWINVRIKRVEGILLIDISNGCPHKKIIPDIKNGLSKNIMHGYGIKSVKSKVMMYGGNMRSEYEGDKYVVNITFFNTLKCENISESF